MNKRSVVSTLGVIVLGAFGSGLWELGKPLLGWLWEALVGLSTLGLDSLRDGIYADAAASLGRPIGLGLAVQVLAALTSLLAASILHSIAMSVPSRYEKLVRAYHWLFLVGAFALLVAASRTAYVSQLSLYYLKLETIAAPYLSDLEIKKRRAAYVQVTGRQGFIQQVHVMSATIEAAGANVPKRDFF
jgi:hypothetical protein